jgi:hypothetical protein
MTSPQRGAPKHFRLVGVWLKAIRPQPCENVINAGGQASAELINVVWPTGTVYLGIIGVKVWQKAMF